MMFVLSTYAVSKKPNKNGEYYFYGVHTTNFPNKEILQAILDCKSPEYENLGMFSEMEDAIQKAKEKGYSPLIVIR
ncbi:hypothetical protein [Fusobacterium necrophorum]|uniref:Uncharacterized protein n=2 Tax=Fusobacterium necrophorum TaxID=859 RepID=A0AAW6WE25_9FUSO|nr:hypothetical protein [Fusobacterium necrophorum]MBR8733124.1 hypothetical protein [Fusobacterium necrophorum]MBR8789332.1 hypothetical protein [Fusobacterium necrophorum]MDK4482076.1 hypothetical protein [Fusobacterium necrophorum]MDK4513064.1 hypothetical protein [Fusobacterium necrophorum]